MAPPLSRRDLFGLFRKSIQATAEPRPLRPPGAIAENEIADSCERCNACMTVCPRQAIKPLPASYGARAGTPYIVPREAPCVVCTGLQCTTVCPTGTLRRVDDPADIDMGRAVINKSRCLPYNGQACSVCVTNCPIPGALSRGTDGRPQVTDACIGCGLCEYYCPTLPSSIVVKPHAQT